MIEQAYSGRILCGHHLAKSIRKKVAKELRKQLVLKKGQHTTIFVAISGGKDSAALLELLVDIIGVRPDVTIIAGTVDEGIEGYAPCNAQSIFVNAWVLNLLQYHTKNLVLKKWHSI